MINTVGVRLAMFGKHCSEKRSLQAKCRVKRCLIVARSGLVRKSDRLFERPCVETLAREPANGLGAAAGCLEQRPGALELGLELLESRLDEVAGEPLAFEREADRGVAVAPPGEGLRPIRGHPGIVDEPGLLERPQGVVPRVGPSAAAREPRLEPAARVVAVAERAQRNAERGRASQLAPERPGGLAVERATDREAGPHHRVGGNEPPRPAVEIDLDTVARPLPQRGDDGRSYAYSSEEGAPTSASAAAAAATFAALPAGAPLLSASSTSGISRAETTCSGNCSWICWRICCVTSGCSRRNAVALWRPWPSRSSPKLKYEPDFVTTLRSMPTSTTVPSQEKPVPYMMSNSACLNGGATLFFTTLTRMRLPIASTPSFSVSMRRMSRRIEA